MKKLLSLGAKKGTKTKFFSVDDLTSWEINYRLDIENKQNSAIEAHRIKKAKKDITNIPNAWKLLYGAF